MDLVACGTCGRNFNQDALTRHAPICKKNAKKKPRKQFDSQKNRLVGTEVNITDLKRKEKKVKLPCDSLVHVGTILKDSFERFPQI